jgi:GGDEF domain-containing protein
LQKNLNQLINYFLASGIETLDIAQRGYRISGLDIDTLLSNADKALYDAKALGKHCVCVAVQVNTL